MFKYVILIILKTIIAVILSLIMMFLLYGFLWAKSYNRQLGITELMYLILLISIYLLPFIICYFNKHKSTKTIIILGLAGLVSPTWPVAFVWSLTKSSPNSKSDPSDNRAIPVKEETPNKTADIYH